MGWLEESLLKQMKRSQAEYYICCNIPDISMMVFIILGMFRDAVDERLEKKRIKTNKSNSKEKKKIRKKQRKQTGVPYAKAWVSSSLKIIKREIKEKLENMKDRNAPEGI